MSFLGKHHTKKAKGEIGKAKKGNKYCLGYKHTEKFRRERSEALMGEKNPMWKGGQITDDHGYVHVKKSEHPRVDRKGYVKRARLVAEEMLGRYLYPDEIPHHKNGIKNDDRPENIEVMTRREHTSFHNAIRKERAIT